MKIDFTKEMIEAYKRGIMDVLRDQLGREATEEEFNEAMKEIMKRAND